MQSRWCGALVIGMVEINVCGAGGARVRWRAAVVPHRLSSAIISSLLCRSHYLSKKKVSRFTQDMTIKGVYKLLPQGIKSLHSANLFQFFNTFLPG